MENLTHAILNNSGYWTNWGRIELHDLRQLTKRDLAIALLGPGNCATWITSEKVAIWLRSALKGTSLAGWQWDAAQLRDGIRFKFHSELLPPASYLCFPELAADWNLKEDDDPQAQIEALITYGELFGRPPLYKASGTGVRLLRDRLVKIGHVDLLKNEEDLSSFAEHQPRAILWVAQPPKRWSYIAAFDKRASYLHAADVSCGIGQKVHASGKEARTVFDFRRPGVWLAVFDRDFDSDIALGMKFVDGWYYTPLLSALRGLGLEFEVVEGYFFQDSYQALRGWRVNFLNALKDATPQLRGLIKATYSRAIGLLGSSQFAHDGLYRPDWRGQVVAEAAARMLWNVEKVYRLSGKLPQAIYDDCLYYHIESEDSEELACFVEDANLASKFQFKGIYDVREAPVSLFQQTPARFATEIKKYLLMKEGER